MSALRSEGLDRGLVDPAVYLAALERVVHRRAAKKEVRALAEDDVTLFRYRDEGPSLASALARSIADGSFVPTPGRRRVLWVGAKQRVLFQFGLREFLVHSALADLVERAASSTWADGLYSYRPGRCPEGAVKRAALFVRTTPGPVFVVRRDVQSYFDQVRTDDDSALWPRLEQRVGSWGPTAQRVLVDTIRPSVRTEGGVVRSDLGIPTGSPIANMVGNVYLANLDDELAELAPSLLALRYGDDLLLLARSDEVAKRGTRLLEQHLAELGLTHHPGKALDRVLSASGRPFDGWRGTQGFDALGLRLTADGTVGLPPAKIRRAVRELRRRALRVSAALGPSSLEDRADVVCAVVSDGLRASSPAAVPEARWLNHVVTDREQLRSADHAIARMVLGVLVGIDGRRGFRRFSYRRLREDHRLLSLVQQRNRSGQDRAPS